jgi:hypothetical protein
MKTTVELVVMYVLQMNIVVGVHVFLDYKDGIAQLVAQFVKIMKHVVIVVVQIFGMMQQIVLVVKMLVLLVKYAILAYVRLPVLLVLIHVLESAFQIMQNVMSVIIHAYTLWDVAIINVSM